MSHEYVSVQIHVIMPMDGVSPFQASVQMVCLCGDQHDCIYPLPPLDAPKDAHDALRQTLEALREAF